MADAQGILQRVFDDGAQALRVLLGGTVAADAPSSPVEGDFWYESDTGSFFVRVGGSWVEIAAGTGTLPGLSDVTITAVADKEVLAYDSGTTEWINQTPSEAGLVAKADYDAQTILAATSDNTPAALTVAEQTLVGRITGGNIDDLSASQVRTLLDVPTTGEAVLDTLYDANTIIKADTDNTPEALTVAEQRIVGRITGGEITGLTAAQTLTMLGTTAIPDSATTRASVTVTDLFGGTVDFGTDGEAYIDYVRVGRIVHCWIYMFAADDWSTTGGPMYITAANMPVAIKDNVSNPANGIPTPRVGGFGFVAYGDDGTPIAFQAPPAYLDIGGGSKGLFFTIQPNTGGLTSILSPTNPEDFTGAAWIYTGYTPLEANAAA